MSSSETWQQGKAYDSYMGRWSSLVADEFLQWLDLSGGLAWLDVGCGTGMLSAAILEHCEPDSIVGVDPSAGFIRRARSHINDPRATFRVADATETGLPDQACDVTVSGLVLNFLNDPALALTESRRVTRPSGVMAAYVWDYADGMEITRSFWDAAGAVDPAAKNLDQGVRFTICNPDALSRLVKESGLKAVDVRAIEVATVFASFDDYWIPFLGGQGSAPGYVASLADEQRVRLREELRRRLPVEADGGIRMNVRAWAVRGQVS